MWMRKLRPAVFVRMTRLELSAPSRPVTLLSQYAIIASAHQKHIIELTHSGPAGSLSNQVTVLPRRPYQIKLPLNLLASLPVALYVHAR